MPIQIILLIVSAIGVILGIISLFLKSTYCFLKGLIITLTSLSVICFILSIIFGNNSSQSYMFAFSIASAALGCVSLAIALITKFLPKNKEKDDSQLEEDTMVDEIKEEQPEEKKTNAVISESHQDTEKIISCNYEKENLEEDKSSIILSQEKDIAEEKQKEQVASDEPNSTKLELSQSLEDNNQIILYSASNIGLGLWTSICVMVASIFGVKSNNYEKKMNKVIESIKLDLQKQMSEYKDFEFSYYKIVKERGLAYYGTVMGKRKTN